jgi:hypothetical protein
MLHAIDAAVSGDLAQVVDPNPPEEGLPRSGRNEAVQVVHDAVCPASFSLAEGKIGVMSPTSCITPPDYKNACVCV